MMKPSTTRLKPSPRDTSNEVIGLRSPAGGSAVSAGSGTISQSMTDSSSDVTSVYSTASSYRHQPNGPFMVPTPEAPQPVLVKDIKHKPKTLGSFGVMIVGFGGANGTTLLAGVLANRLGISWYGPKGEPMTANYFGCITQLNQKGIHGGVGYRDKVKGLADASMAAIGGWVRSSFVYYTSLMSIPADLPRAGRAHIMVPWDGSRASLMRISSGFSYSSGPHMMAHCLLRS